MKSTLQMWSCRLRRARSGCRYAAGALAMVRAVVHNDREALYVFQLQIADTDTTIPNMVENGEVRLQSPRCVIHASG